MELNIEKNCWKSIKKPTLFNVGNLAPCRLIIVKTLKQIYKTKDDNTKNYKRILARANF